MPFADAEGLTGVDVMEANDAMSSVMDTAVAAVSTALTAGPRRVCQAGFVASGKRLLALI
jgi:hypothetical protein